MAKTIVSPRKLRKCVVKEKSPVELQAIAFENKCKESKDYDAGKREKMKASRKRKLTQTDVNFAGKMLKKGSSSMWTTCAVNNRIEFAGRGEKAKVTRRTLERTFHGKYDAITHRRQTKGTGSKDVNSIWAQCRLAIAKQFHIQIGLFYLSDTL